VDKGGASPLRRALDGPVAAVRPWLILILVCGGFSLHPDFAHTFWTREYLPNIAQQAATNIILAVGMTFVILTGGIDLSVGSVLALCGVALGLTVKTGPPPFLAWAMALPVGVLAAMAVNRLARPSPLVLGVVTVVTTSLVGLVIRQATLGGI